MKNKKMIGLLTFVLFVTLILAACGQKKEEAVEKDEGTKSEGPKITLRLADNQPADYPTVIGDQKFAELVSERSEGRITIEVFPSGQLGDEKSVPFSPFRKFHRCSSLLNK